MTAHNAPDLDLDAVAEHCYAAVFSDICDQFGNRHQTTRPGLRRFSRGGNPRGVGPGPSGPSPSTLHRAATTAGEIDFIDSLRPRRCGGRGVPARGGGLGRAVLHRLPGSGGKGSGHSRHGPRHSQDPRSRLPAVRIGHEADRRAGPHLAHFTSTSRSSAWECRSRPGDLVVADDDGVAFVPRSIAVGARRPARCEKATTEDRARDLLLEGAKLADVWGGARSALEGARARRTPRRPAMPFPASAQEAPPRRRGRTAVVTGADVCVVVSARARVAFRGWWCGRGQVVALGGEMLAQLECPRSQVIQHLRAGLVRSGDCRGGCRGVPAARRHCRARPGSACIRSACSSRTVRPSSLWAVSLSIAARSM